MVQDRDREVQLFNKNILLKPGATIEGAITNFGWMLKCISVIKLKTENPIILEKYSIKFKDRDEVPHRQKLIVKN